ncbi:MerR family transcriptional regulator [Bacillus sp. J37]|uniref:MerR family transcriptional regulator n=1 Tax=Bacillus sp. J37 TaxID=935837 RepID=UPI00047B3E99|nr:MerR family transcriptional regulator [Bacillus sp. J37]
MEDKLYSIGEVSKLMNISIKALRYYDQIDLFKPTYVDPKSNYRYYSDLQLYRLDLIKSLSYIGTPLNQIKRVEDLNNDDYVSFLMDQERIVEEKIDYLFEIQEIIANVREELQRQEAPFDEIVLLEKDEMKVIQTKVTGLGPINTFNSSFSSLRKYGPSTEGFRKKGYGSIIPFRPYNTVEDINYDYLFTPVLSNKHISSLQSDTEFATLPKGKYLSIVSNSTSFEHYFVTFQKLIHYIQTNEVKPLSDIYEFFSVYYQNNIHQYISEFRVKIAED